VIRKSKPKREEIEKMKRIDMPNQTGMAVEGSAGDPTTMMIAIDLEIGDVIKKSYEIQNEQLGCRQKREGIERFVSIPLRTLDISLTTQEQTTRRRTSRERDRDGRREDSEDRRRGHKGRSSGDTRRSDRRRSDPPSSGSIIDKLFDKGVKIVKDTFGGDKGR